MNNNTSKENSKQKNVEFIPNFTQYPNEILDSWMPYLTGTQFKIVSCFVRQIYGYHKQEGKLSIRLIHEITGIARSKVFDNIKKLIKIGCIQITKKGNKSNPHTYKIINITDKLPERGQFDNDDDSPQKGIGYTQKGATPIPQKGTHLYPEGGQLNKEINIKERCEIKSNYNNIEETEINAEPIQKTHPIDIDAKYQQNLIEINNRYDSNLLSLPKFTTDELLDNSDKFLQNLGIGFEFNPRNILNKIYSNLPKDFAIKEDKDDIATIKQFIDKYSSVTTAERDAMSKRLYQGIETMVKIYVIKIYGEEFRGKLYPEQLNKNLILYLNCNPSLKYCLSGWSNDVDGVYNEVVRIIRTKTEKQKREFYTQWQREISAENAERQYMERELIPEEEKIARRKRTESILRGFRDAGKGNIADESANPYFGIRTEEEENELANLRKMTLDLFDAGTRPDPSITARIEQLLKKIGRS